MKKLLSIILCLCMVTGLSITVSANDTTAKTVEYIAQNWIDTQLSGTAEVLDMVKLYDMDGNYTGQIISFKQGSKPAGYIVLSKKESVHPIVEYALEGESVYSYLTHEFAAEKAANQLKSNESRLTNIIKSGDFKVREDKVLYTDFIDYALKIESNDKTLLYNQSKEITDSEVRRSPSKDTFFDGYIDMLPNGSNVESGTIWGASSDGLVMSRMPGVSSGEGNCGPTSLANTVKLYAENGLNQQSPMAGLRVNGNDNDTYKRLVAISGYTASSPASMSKLLSSLKSYGKERGYSCSIDNYWFDYWSDFTRDINNKKPILLYTSSKAGSAHSQVVVGYFHRDNGSKYLKIFTGWTKKATFVKFKPDSLNHFNGYCVKIKK